LKVATLASRAGVQCEAGEDKTFPSFHISSPGN
jgi:hypothetical protein